MPPTNSSRTLLTAPLPHRCHTVVGLSHAAAARGNSSTSSPLRYRYDTRPATTAAARQDNAYSLSPCARRGYATIAGDPMSAASTDPSSSSSPSPPDDMPWPKAPKGHSHPTPYQILSTTEAEPYSKRRFYELVKLYHPDSGACEKHHHHHSVPQTLRLERYRLVVAAHTILSDPDKRKMYDRFGAGWSGVPSTVGGKPGAGAPAGPFSGWRHHADSDIWGNATWEDWERFYARRDGVAQQPRYLSNGNFILCVILFAMIGASLNISRAESEGDKVVAARDLVHDRASKELRRVRQLSENRPKEERIQFFLRQREATMHGVGVESLRDDKAAKLLPEQETCLSEELRSGGTES
ncbi:hypothetical protein E4T49_00698 [Aureobasidium sp. EXF-10728]|nr:hypothetical protein E4T49_00698 [Aureobasidium sp. EXF-10728]